MPEKLNLIRVQATFQNVTVPQRVELWTFRSACFVTVGRCNQLSHGTLTYFCGVLNYKRDIALDTSNPRKRQLII
jgi:hypothetical protein